MRQLLTRNALLTALFCFFCAGPQLQAQELAMKPISHQGNTPAPGSTSAPGNTSAPGSTSTPGSTSARAGSRLKGTESLADVLGKLESAFRIYFGYDHQLVKDIRVPLRLAKIVYQDPDQQLSHLLSPLKLEFVRIGEKDYVIRREKDVLSDEQQNIVNGIVSDEDGVPLPGVSVQLKGSNTGTSTSLDGAWQLSIPAEEAADAVIVFSLLGYQTMERALNGRTELNTQLQTSAAQLDEVVVTALGISRDKRSLGYSVGEVDGEEMNNVGNENLLTSLSGRVSGVTINQTSGIGSSSSIIIRGASSLRNNQPLFVVDGVPIANSLGNVSEKGNGNKVDYGNAISDINPADIANISVLKGPSAAALYGSRAGNGVILITTKSGKKGQGLGVNFSSSNVFEVPYRFLDLHYKYATGERPFNFDETSSYWGGIPLDKGNKAVQWNSPLDEQGNPIPTELKSYPDNAKNFLETGFTSTNNLAVSGSTEKSTYRVSYNNMTHSGLIPNSGLHRNGLSANGTYNILENLSLSSNVNFTRTNSDSRPATSERNGNPLQHVYNWPHIDIREMKDYWAPGKEDVEQAGPAPGDLDNPYFLAYELLNAFNRDRIFGNLRLDWTIEPGLTAFARLAHDSYNENRETRLPWSYSEMGKGGYFLEDIGRRETNADFLVTQTSEFDEFDLSISAGGNYMKQHSFSSDIGGNDLSVPGLYRISNIPKENREANNYVYNKAIYSLYALASFGFNNQLYLDLTARNDWSSTLPGDSRSYFYPSASLSWLANYTLNLPESVSLLKLRGGWAQVGNDADPYQLAQTLGIGSWGDLVTANVPSTLLNPQLKPEIATSVEGGVDLNMYDNRLRFDFTYYNLVNRNQVLPIPTPSSSGPSNRLINAGELQSRGWELGIGGTPIDNKNGWSLDISANFSRNRVILKELYPGLEFYELWGENGGGAYTYVGEEMGNMYSSKYAQVEDPASPYYRWPIIDYDGDGNGGMQWTELGGKENAVKVGNFNPDFLMGLQLDLRYKRFSLNMSFDWRQGGDFMSFTYRYGESDWKGQRQIDNLIPGSLYTPEELVNLLKSDPEKYIIPQNGNFPRVGGHTAETGGFGPEGDGAFIPGVYVDKNGEYQEWLGGEGTIYQPITNVYPWDFNKQVTFDASFIKMREVSISYQIPELFGVTRNVTLSLFSRNIMLWTASKIGIDPERAFWADPGRGGFRQGIERQNIMPWTMPVGFKLDVNF